MGRGPLKQRLTASDAVFILAMAENGLRVHRAAKSMPLSNNAAAYHVNKMKKEFGLDPRDFYDMLKLLPMARAVLDEREE
jgi:hypothetical protein